MKPNRRGLYDDEVVFHSGLPIYDEYGEDLPSDYWTYSDLKRVVKITLTKCERQTLIKGFQKVNNRQKDYAALYSLTELIRKRYNRPAKFINPFKKT